MNQDLLFTKGLHDVVNGAFVHLQLRSQFRNPQLGLLRCKTVQNVNDMINGLDHRAPPY
ncbi:protein of unknown function [Kyrpidia spormannii]|uniref:Uncharacterized protein n=1 Tax=Kyrpidia spormannii TaxID=2055160 RepID=A0ACA8ZBL1_9BACL|nr:protein of unknown function [Kyrpidia spormannii]